MNLVKNIQKVLRRETKLTDKALVVLSGGQDSTLCLLIAMLLHDTVEAIHFTYGQRHSIETKFVKNLCSTFHINLKIIDLSFLRDMVTSVMTNHTSNISASHPHKPDLPSSFVPARNAIFLTVAHGYAQEQNSNLIYTGVCQTDFSGYPDCRQEFIDQLKQALNTGYQTEIDIVTPLMYMTKADTFRIAADLNQLNTIITETLTCYEGSEIFNEWGYGCGVCPSCKLRKKGYAEFLEGKANPYV